MATLRYAKTGIKRIEMVKLPIKGVVGDGGKYTEYDEVKEWMMVPRDGLVLRHCKSRHVYQKYIGKPKLREV